MTRLGERTNKYGNHRTEWNGRVFASKAEARRAAELELMQRAGEITNLEYQPRYLLKINGQMIATYVGDWCYFEGPKSDMTMVVEDCKGVRTPVYKLKRKLMRALYGIEIRET